MRLTPKDEKVIQAFYEQTSAESKKLYTDGKVLDGLWMGGNAIAEWEGRKIKFNDLGSNASVTVQRAVKKYVPANYLKLSSTRRSASEVIRSLEGRIARLEAKNASFNPSKLKKGDLVLYFAEGQLIRGEFQRMTGGGAEVLDVKAPKGVRMGRRIVEIHHLREDKALLMDKSARLERQADNDYKRTDKVRKHLIAEFGQPTEDSPTKMEFRYRNQMRDPNHESMKIRDRLEAKGIYTEGVWADDGYLVINFEA